MSERDGRLSDMIRLLAQTEPREASAHVEVVLRNAFRHHRAVRKLRRAVAGVLSTVAVAAAMFVVTHRPVEKLRQVAAPVVVSNAIRVDVPVSVAVRRPAPQAASRVRKQIQRPTVHKVITTDFVALPYGDDSLVDESMTIVRIEMPRSALRLAGFMVSPDRADERVQADVVLGADGLAHAVRFVRFLE